MTAHTLHRTIGGMTRALANMAGYQTQHVLICVTSHYRGFTTYEVLVDGEIYHVDKHQLQALQDGITPDELCLDPVDDDGRM